MKKIGTYIFFILLSIVFFNACKSKEQAIRILLEKKEKEERILNLIRHSVEFETFSGSLSLAIKPGEKSKSTTAGAQLKIKKDEVVDLSLYIPFIMKEVFRMYITPDSLLIIDRINKLYFTESMHNLKNRLPFDFDYFSMQALFSNQLFIAGKEFIDQNELESFGLREDEFQVYLRNTDSQGINYDFTSDYTNRILQTKMYKGKGDVNMSWDYKEFGLTSNNRLFPMLMQMKLQLPEDNFSMNMIFNKIEINTPFVPEVKIPEKYTRINMEQVIKIIQSL
jgi:hypothetical protein